MPMRQVIRTKGGLSDMVAVKQRFLLLNRERLRRAQESMREWQRDFIDLLPLLFHVNHPILPGFVGKDTPVGVSDYRPGERALHVAYKIAKSFEYSRKALPRYDIHAIFMMGSSGTIAYSQESDFDIWLCYNPDLKPAQLVELQQKANTIETWANGLDLEVHFFLMNAQDFKAGRHSDLSKESSGTAQHYLLLEEFYRTGLLIAGRYPLWWFVPPEHEVNYDENVKSMLRRRVLREGEFIDFGNVARIPPEEFFGAALWHVFKGIDSPYKSVLKLLLMEVYASQYPNVDLLCHRFKKSIYDGEVNLNQLDPYIMLYRLLEEYLLAKGEEDRLDFVRRCFYFKVNERLSVPVNPRHASWRREIIEELAKSWGWNADYLEMLDTRREWKINRVQRERKVLVSELTHSYHLLSEFARKQAALALIDQKDMTVLGRKLYAAFERKAGKVEIINRGISEDVREPRLAFHRLITREDQESWELRRGGMGNTDNGEGELLKRARSVFELIAWGHFNGLLDERTAFAFHATDSDLTLKEVQSVIMCLQKMFPVAKVMETNLASLDRPVKVERAVIFINIGLDPMAQRTRQGRHLMTKQTDSLNYSGLGENLAVTFDQLIFTSWNEVLASRHIEVNGLLNCLSEYLRWSPPSTGEAPHSLEAFCFSPGRGVAIGKRIKELFDDVIDCYYGKHASLSTRYVLGIEQLFYALSIENDVLRYERVGAQQDLMRYLSEGRKEFTPVLIDRYALANTLLPDIFRNNMKGVVQVFYRVDGEMSDVYILDERGSLFNHRIPFFDRAALVNHYSVFFDAVLKRQKFDILSRQSDMPATEVEFYEIIVQKNGDRQMVRQAGRSVTRRGGYFNVQVIAEHLEGDKPTFSIYCDDMEFTTLMHGNQLFEEVAVYILKQRQSGQRYPIYITDIDLPRTMLGAEPSGRVQTIYFLNYKKQIEQRLNDALMNIGRT